MWGKHGGLQDLWGLYCIETTRGIHSASAFWLEVLRHKGDHSLLALIPTEISWLSEVLTWLGELSSLAAKMAPNQEILGPLLTPFLWLPLYSRSHSLLSPLPSHSSFLLSLSASFLCDYRHCMVISAKLICTTTVNWLQQLINVLEIWHWKKKVCHQNKGKKL